MSHDLQSFKTAIGAIVRSLPESIPPDQIARAVVYAVSQTHRCPVVEIAAACEQDLAALNFDPPPSPSQELEDRFRWLLDLATDGLKLDPETIAKVLAEHGAAVLNNFEVDDRGEALMEIAAKLDPESEVF